MLLLALFYVEGSLAFFVDSHREISQDLVPSVVFFVSLVFFLALVFFLSSV